MDDSQDMLDQYAEAHPEAVEFCERINELIDYALETILEHPEFADVWRPVLRYEFASAVAFMELVCPDEADESHRLIATISSNIETAVSIWLDTLPTDVDGARVYKP